jgi:hypothetical protein
MSNQARFLTVVSAVPKPSFQRYFKCTLNLVYHISPSFKSVPKMQLFLLFSEHLNLFILLNVKCKLKHQIFFFFLYAIKLAILR